MGPSPNHAVTCFSPKIQSITWDVGSASSDAEVELNFLRVRSLFQSWNSGLCGIRPPQILTKLAS